MTKTQASTPAPWSQWSVIEALGEGVYGVDTAGCCVFVNPAALQLLGYESADELIGRNMHATIHHTRADGSPFPQAECPLLNTQRTGRPVRLDHEMLWRRDGSPLVAEYSSFPLFSDGRVTGSVITFSDSTARQGMQQRLALQHTVSQVLGGTEPFAAMLERLLQTTATGLGWQMALLWLRSFDGRDPICVARWTADDAAGGFAEASLGACLGGGDVASRSWAGRAPVHVGDLALAAAEGREQAARRAGLRSAFAFPLAAEEWATGVMELYDTRSLPCDDALLDAATLLGRQIGQALERRRIADALAGSEHLKSAILAASPDGIVLIDANGRVLEFNPAAEEIFGQGAAAMKGRDLAAAIFPETSRDVHLRAFSRALEGDTAAIGRRMEVTAMRGDGSLFPLELSVAEAILAPNQVFAVYLRDITTRRRAETRVRESEQRFRTIANGIPQLAWMTGPDGTITWYNQRWYDYTGTGAEDMAGWGWKSVHHPDHLDRVERRLRAAFSAGQSWEDTFPLRAADGTYRWFLSRALPIRADPDEDQPEGAIIGWFGTNTDITAFREAEQSLAAARDEAEAANRAKSTFIANMSHELRTPLSAIIGYAEMMAEEMADRAGDPNAGATLINEELINEELIRDIRKIEANARHLLGLINDILDLSKIESGKMDAFAETFDVRRMVEDLAATVSPLVEKRGNRLVLSIAGDVASIHSDVTRLRQILLNLLSNAAKFTEDGTITLVVTREAGPNQLDRLAFSVTDTGIGMTEAQLEKLFQRFQQADASTTRQYGGTGLGLALTRAFADLLGGTIEVSSREGRGSTFTVRVPAILPHRPDTAAAAHAADPDVASGGDIILVVDDDPTQLDLTSRFLAREGFSPRVASDGATGLALARQLRPRAILLDVTMPGMDGWSVLSTLKLDPDLTMIPVVMVTFASERALATSLGAADYLMKPVDWDRLRLVIDRFRDTQGNVLVVDDDADTRERIRHALERNGWSVVEAANGAEALDSVGQARPRLVLLDLVMPVMDGFAFLEALRARPDGAGVPVIVLTALSLTAEDRRRLRGASQVLNKGDVSLTGLVERLRHLEVQWSVVSEEAEDRLLPPDV